MTQYLIDIIKSVVNRTSNKLLTTLQAIEPLITKIHFEYGHIPDIQQRLVAFEKAGESPYPLICLFEDYGTDVGDEGLDGVSTVNMIALYRSRADYTREQRELTVIKPILVPIYNEFLKQLKICGQFNIYDETKISHTRIIRPHWGDPSLYKSETYIFDAVLDGIELSNLQLETYLKTC